MTRWARLGEHTVRVEVPTGVTVEAALAGVAQVPGVVEAWAGEAHVAVVTAAPWPDGDAVAAAVTAAGPTPAGAAPKVHRVPVRYDGVDLAEVAERLGLSAEAVVARHAGAYRVGVVGFAPGFAYLGPLPPALRLPRRATPRPRVPAGAVAIAGDRTAVYPGGTGGGWWILGQALDFAPFDPARGAVLAVGDHVHFEVAR